MMSMLRDPNGEISMAKVWSNVAFAIATYVVFKQAATISYELLLVYLACVGGAEIAKKFLTMKYGGENAK